MQWSVPLISLLIHRRIKQTDASKLQDEYSRLVEGLQDSDEAEDNIVGAPGAFPCLHKYWHGCIDASITVLPEDLLKEAIPGNIRKAEHFVAFLKRLVEYLKVSASIIALDRC